MKDALNPFKIAQEQLDDAARRTGVGSCHARIPALAHARTKGHTSGENG